LLLKLDKERQTYGMKESVLGKLYVEILGISPTSEDALCLIHWRRPTTATTNTENIGAGDFGTAVWMSLRNRCPPKGDLSIADINTSLDKLNAASDRLENDIS
jgi:DNA ligase-4